MAKIYMAEWDYSVEQFAVTDNTSTWLVRSSDRDFYKGDSSPTIVTGFYNAGNGNWCGCFAFTAIGQNSEKTANDARTALRMRVGSSTGINVDNIVTKTLSEYPNTVFYCNQCGYATQNPSVYIVREPLASIDWERQELDDILRKCLQTVGFEEGRPTPLDPYSGGGTTQPTEIPSGDFDNTSDPIPPAPLPTLSAVNANFITLFAPNLTQLQALATYMWGSAFDLDTFKKLFTDPMAAILGLSIVPVTPSVSGTVPVTLGNITTSVSMPIISSQYVTVTCGTLNVNEYWGAYLDYSPYTKLEIFLPYIGIQTLDADDIMGRSVTVTYNIDVLSGACVAMLTCGNSVLYSFAGSCATSVPITGRDWTNMINGIIGIATGAAGIAVAGAAGGAAVAAGAAGTLLGSTANSLTSMKPTVQKSGTMASSAGMLGIQRPYLILTRPRQALPEDQNTFTGYPSYITETLGNLSGYTIVDRIHLSGFYALDAELAEIETLLTSGVIL